MKLEVRNKQNKAHSVLEFFFVDKTCFSFLHKVITQQNFAIIVRSWKFGHIRRKQWSSHGKFKKGNDFDLDVTVTSFLPNQAFVTAPPKKLNKADDVLRGTRCCRLQPAPATAKHSILFLSAAFLTYFTFIVTLCDFCNSLRRNTVLVYNTCLDHENYWIDFFFPYLPYETLVSLVTTKKMLKLNMQKSRKKMCDGWVKWRVFCL